MTKARLYVAGEPAKSLSEAVVALTYGAYVVAADSAGAEAEADGDREEPPVLAAGRLWRTTMTTTPSPRFRGAPGAGLRAARRRTLQSA